MPRDRKFHKIGSDNHSLQHCFQQSTGNLANLQIDIGSDLLGNGFLNQDISDLLPATRF